MNLVTKSLKFLCLLAIIVLVVSKTKAQTTYYWVHNQAVGGTTYLNDQITIGGVTYWKHLSTVSGSTLTANLTPTASLSFAGMGNDEIVIDNNSFTYTVPTNVTIRFNTNITIRNITTTLFTGGTGGNTTITYLDFGVSSTTTVKKDISMTTSSKLQQIRVITTLEVDPNSGVTSNLLFGQRLVNCSGTFLLRGNGGTFNFNDSLITTGTGYITIRSNTATDALNTYVNFYQGISLKNKGINIDRGSVYFYKAVANNDLGVQTSVDGTKFVYSSGIVIGTTVAANSGYTHVIFNTGTTYTQNRFNRIGFTYNGGRADFSDVLADSSALVSSTVAKVFPGGPTSPSAPIDTFLTNANTKFNILNKNYGYNSAAVFDWRTAAVLNGVYNFDAMQGATGGDYNYVTVGLNYTLFKDTVHFKNNAQITVRDGAPLGATFAGYNTIIDASAVMILDKGYVYNLSNTNYTSSSFAYNNLHIKGKLIVGGPVSCEDNVTVLKNANINFNYSTSVLPDIQNTQLISTRAIPKTPSTFVSINASNTDMGGNQGWGIGGVAYGTAPYNTLPYTGTSARALLWDNTISGATYWSEAKWYNTADGDNLYNDCPPTFIDSVMVKSGSTLIVDSRFAQCKTLWFQPGATKTNLIAKGTTATDSLITLEVFGSFIIDSITGTNTAVLNNRFYRNIHFKAWQSYPKIKTFSTNFHRGLAFQSLNSAPTTGSEINNGAWTLQDSLFAYSSAETFTTAPAPAALGTQFIVNRKFWPMIDVSSFWPSGYNCSGGRVDHSFLLLKGKLITNGFNVHAYDFFMGTENTILSTISAAPGTRSLDMRWVATPTVGINRKTTFNIYNAVNCNTSPPNWYANSDGGRTTIYPDSSHIRIHTPNGNMIANALSNDKALYYWDVTFMFCKPTLGAFSIGAQNFTGFDGSYQGGKTHARHITFYGSDYVASRNNVVLYNDTIRKLTFLDTRSNSKTSFHAASTGAMIDSLISNPPTSNVFGNNKIRKYLYLSSGSNNALNTSTISVYQPTVTIRTRRDSLTHSYVQVWPYGAQITFTNSCYAPGVITGGRIVNAGDAVAYPVPHYYLNPSPRDTFNITNASINSNTLTASQTVDASNTLNTTVNWVAGAASPRCLYFRGNASAHGGNWNDNNVWARVISYSPFTLGGVGECAPTCADTVVFDNQSFLVTTDSCYFTSGTSAYAGLLRWKNGAIGKLSSDRTSQLTICYAWDCENGTLVSGMDNRFFGRTIFVSPRSDAYIRSSGMMFSGPVEYISSNSSTGRLSLIDSLSFKPLLFNFTGLPNWSTYSNCYSQASAGLYVVSGVFDSRGKNILSGIIESPGAAVRGIYLRNSKVILRSTSGGGHGGYILGGTLANHTNKTDSAIINIVGGAGGNCAFGLYTWLNNSLGATYMGGVKFKTVNIISNTGYGIGIRLRNDTIIDTLNIQMNPSGVVFNEAFLRARINKMYVTGTTSGQSFNMGNANTFASKNAFQGLRINEFTFMTPSTAISTHSFKWDSIFVRDKYIINAPGSTIIHTSGGVTFFGNKCKVLIEGGASGTLRIDAAPNTKVYPNYNIPGSPSYTTAEHYYRKDSGTVCTEYTNIYNLWAIGNGDEYATPTHGTWTFPNPSPSPHYSLMDTTQASSYFYGTPVPIAANYNRVTNPSAYSLNTSLAGRARFYVGQNATLISNAKGWDDNKYPPVPSLTIATVTYSICQTQSVTLTFTGVASLPFDLVYYNNLSALGDTVKILVPSDLDNYDNATNTFTYTTVVQPTASINYYLGYVVTDRCTNAVSATGTGTTSIIVKPSPSVILATSSPTSICNGLPFVLNANATAGQTYSLFPTSTGTASPTPMTSYTVGAAVNGSVTIPAGTYTAGYTPETYTVYAAATTSLGCTSLTRTPVQITINPTPSVAITSQTNVACFGNATGAISYSATGGSGGYNISPSITGLTAGVYNYTVTDANGCKTSTTVSITQPSSALTAITSGTNNTSCTVADGQVSVSPSGGTSSYSYLWSTGASTLQTVTGLTGGTYTVSVTDANLCTYTTQATIANPSAPFITASTSTNTICSGNTVTITPSGGATTYSIIPSIGTTMAGVTGATIVTPTTTTSYSVVGTNSTSCLSNTITLNITVNAIPVVTISATSNTICNGQSTILNLSGASTYTLLNTGSTITSGTSFNPSATTIYTIQGETAGCMSANTQQLITVNPLPIVTASTSSSSICSGNTVTLTAGGAGTYTWTNPSSTNTVITVNPATSTNYSVIGTDVNGCVNSQTVAINVNPTPTVLISASSGTICSGASTTLTAATADNYSWSSGQTINAITVAPTTNTVYTVVGTNVAGTCTASAQYSVTVKPKPDMTLTNTTSIVCLGEANGTATVNTTSGTAGFTYTWTGSSSTSSVATGLASGTHTAIVTDAEGCKDTLLVTITAPVLSLSTSVNTSTTGCSLSNGTATVTASGGWDTGYTYLWQSNASTTTTATGYSAGTYSVQVTDANGCVKVQNFTISNPATPTISALAANTTMCSGLSTIITPSGAVTYTISGVGVSSPTVGTNFTVNPISNTTYSIVGIDASNCVSATATVAINVNPTPTVLISASSGTICSGASTTLTAATADNYSWSSGQTINAITVAPTTNTVYTVVGTNVAGTCTASAQYSVTVNPTPTVLISASLGTICSGESTTLTAATADNYSWSSGQTTNAISVAPTANTVYTVVGTNAAGTCTASAQYSVTVNQLPVITVVTVTNVTCFGANNGAATFTNTLGTPGYTITGTNISGTIATSLAPNNYTYTVIDAVGCVNTTTLAITQPTSVVTASAVVTATNSSCTNPNGIITISAIGGTPSYSYAIDGGAPITNSVTTGLGTGMHSFVVYDANGCTATTGTLNIIGTPGITSSIASMLPVSCYGNSTGSVSISGMGGAVYNYSLTNTTTSVTITNTTGNFTGLTAGTYTALVKEQTSNCISTNTIIISEPTTPLSLVGITVNSVVCNGGTAQVTAIVTGGTPNYTYVWGANSSTVSTATYSAGNYNVSISDANGCLLTTQNFTVAEAPVLVISSVATTTTGCNLSNGTATITPTGGWATYNYTVTGISGTMSNTNTATSLPAGTYTANVSDALGCATQTVFTITNPITPTLSITSNNIAICAGNSVTLTPTGAVSYTLTSPFMTFATSTVLTPSNTTVYNITGTDASNCTSSPLTITVTVNELPILSLSSSNSAICLGNTATLTANASGTLTVDTYTWSTGVSATSTETVFPTSQTVYTVAGTNTLTGCISAVQSVTIDVNQLPTLAVSSQTNVTCLGGSDGILTFTTNAITPSYSPATTGLSAGVYTFTVTDLSTTCTNTVLATVTAPTASLVISSVATTTTGCGLSNGTATITPTGGWSSSYTYSVNGVATGSVVTGLSSGSYTAQVNDAVGCLSNSIFTVTNPNAPILSITSNTATICAGNSITLTPTGAVSYTITNPTQSFLTDVVLTPSTTTTYSIVGVDASNCTSAPLMVTVTVNVLPTVSISTTSMAICSGNTATLTASGANTYSWTSGPATADYTVNIAGIYTVTGTDANNCSNTQTISLTVNTLPIVSVLSQTNVLCFGNTTGEVVITTSAITPSISPSTTGLGTGVHTFTVVDLTTSCSNTITATITGPSVALTANVANTVANTSCATPNGAYTVTAMGGTPSYTYNTTNTTGVFVNQGTGTHNVVVSDANGCTYSVSATVSGVPTPSIASSTQTNVLCNGGNTGAVDITVNGGTAPYTYNWSAGPNNLTAGTYTVTVLDAGSCTVSQVFVITEPPALNVITTNTTAPCVGQTNGDISIEVSGGMPSYSIVWNPTSVINNTGNTSTISDIGEGNYTAIVTDANGCNYQYPVTLKSANGIGCNLFIPEIFSPNGDGKNDTWEIKGIENYPNNNVTVFNRWGDEVYSAKPYKNDWDGTNIGDKSILGKGILPVGTYYFILDLGNGDKPITGYVQLTK